METFTYIIKSITILSIFYIIYRIVLQKDTFFTANRHYLLTGIIAAMLFPFLEYTKTIYKDVPVIDTPIIDDVSFVAVTESIVQQESQAFVINWWQVALVIYGIGFCIMMIRLGIQLFSLNKLISLYPKTYKDGYTYVQITDRTITPFSFFKTICYNPNLHSSKELHMILAHEKIHVRQRHTIDVLLTQCILAIQWLNPLAWLYKKSLEQNLEFIADNGAIQEVTSSKEYQRTLVKVSSTIVQPALTNNFYHSLIKKRIVMLNKQTSRKRNLWKLGLVLPALALFMYSFNIKEVIEYREVSSTPENAIESSSESISILGENVSLIKNNKNANGAVVNNKAVSTSNEQKQFTITNTTTDVYLKSIETYFAKTFKSTLIRFTKVNHIDDQLVSFEFQTKMENDTRFFTRFSIDNTESFNPFNLIPVAEHEILMADVEGTQIKFTPEQSVSRFTEQESTTSQESMGENPILVINGKIIPKNKEISYSYGTDQGITALLPSKAMSLYGNKAKDGAIIINDPNYTTKVNGKYINTAKTNATANKTIVATAFKVRITKNTTNAELETIQKNLKENHSVEIDYSVTRNNNNEITGLKIKYKTAKNNTGNYAVSGDSPIADVYIFEDEDGSTGIGNAGSSAEIIEQMEERQALLQERYEQMEELHKERQEEMEVIQEEHRERRRELEERVEKQEEKYKERLEIQEKKMEERQKAIEERRAILLEKREKMSEVRQKALKEKRKLLEEKRKEMHKKHIKNTQVAQGYNNNSQRLFITSSPNGATLSTNDGGGYITLIKSTMTNNAIKDIGDHFKKNNIKYSYSNLKRNAKGEITRINVQLKAANGNKTKASFGDGKKAIPIISLGFVEKK
ncbi:M56 family metallopeptidase [uncultured Dokdonia sp.]|uniref:M56 family metallopeptidase n=1 Tax=uncultured Dokdonia sp. TaxID=575653 RepID=UPI0026111312|nr:M56 family metallopeptidase [uncultured Dokdonia sp.]